MLHFSTSNTFFRHSAMSFDSTFGPFSTEISTIFLKLRNFVFSLSFSSHSMDSNKSEQESASKLLNFRISVSLKISESLRFPKARTPIALFSASEIGPQSIDLVKESPNWSKIGTNCKLSEVFWTKIGSEQPPKQLLNRLLLPFSKCGLFLSMIGPFVPFNAQIFIFPTQTYKPTCSTSNTFDEKLTTFLAISSTVKASPDFGANSLLSGKTNSSILTFCSCPNFSIFSAIFLCLISPLSLAYSRASCRVLSKYI
mmetsp:Transcript_6145/g.9211  ORF Transcript_6145/g.9211 Transcript_6145/m.9211 type:complete len:255 (+) Transcript_6145:342-1106(+)